MDGDMHGWSPEEDGDLSTGRAPSSVFAAHGTLREPGAPAQSDALTPTPRVDLSDALLREALEEDLPEEVLEEGALDAEAGPPRTPPEEEDWPVEAHPLRVPHA